MSLNSCSQKCLHFDSLSATSMLTTRDQNFPLRTTLASVFNVPTESSWVKLEHEINVCKTSWGAEGNAAAQGLTADVTSWGWVGWNRRPGCLRAAPESTATLLIIVVVVIFVPTNKREHAVFVGLCLAYFFQLGVS